MANVIGIVGYEYEDIVVYLAKICRQLEMNVVIVDRTEQEILWNLLCKDNSLQQEESYEYEDIVITCKQVREEEFDVVFMAFGYRLNHPRLLSCEKLIMVTDGMPVHAILLRKLANWNREECLIIRNLVPMTHGTGYLRILSGGKRESLELGLEEADVRARCSIGPGGKISFRRLSKDLRKILLHLTEWILQEDRKKEVINVLKQK